MDRNHRQESDASIIARVLDGDTDAFSILLERHRDHVFRIVARRVPSDQAGETAHEVFVRAYRSLRRFEGRSPFPNWLAGIAVRTCHDFWRERYRSREIPMNSLGEEHRRWIENTAAVDDAVTGDTAESRRTARELLLWALSGLSSEDRAVLDLIHLEEYSVAEASSILGWSRSKVKIRAFRARRRLRDILEKELD